ncbi:hypothetical protein [Halorientalis sp.]|jgi:hypothetical protein|uniref:hypothetical protein n=1 Tax=Halorientalis sp. TaxID=1931229 RepID=UPI0026311EEE|nr:hypothetical protein [Halorientalis sp.]
MDAATWSLPVTALDSDSRVTRQFGRQLVERAWAADALDVTGCLTVVRAALTDDDALVRAAALVGRRDHSRTVRVTDS